MNRFIQDIREEMLQYYDAIVVITPKLLIALIILLASWFIARQIRRISDRKLKKQMEDPLLANFLATMIRSVIFIIGLLFAFKVMGFGGITASILAGAGITAFIIGFALRDIGENFLAGILMAFKRPFRVGDFIESGAVKGRVVMLSIRDTQIKTPDGKDIFIPNANIIKNPLINYTVDGFLRYDLTVSLPEGSNYKEHMKRIRESVSEVEGILKRRRKTTVEISGITAGKVDVMVSYWIDNFASKNRVESIRTEVMFRVKKLLQEMHTDQN